MVDFPVAKHQENGRAAGPRAWLVARIIALCRGLFGAIVDAVTQRRNFILFPFAMIAGLIFYRVVPGEPSFIALALMNASALIVAWTGRDVTPVREIALLALMFSIGTTLLPLHAVLFGTPMLDAPRYGTYTARIEAVTYDDGAQQRWVLSNISGELDWTIPDVRLARVTVSGAYDVSPGDEMTARIRFYPVPPPAVPGGYDSQFVSHFDGIGAYGNAFGEIDITKSGQGGLVRVVKDVRTAITARIVAQLDERIGGIAAALVTGDQSRITEADRDLMASAGIAHVISISGLHLTLVAGTMFTCVRFLLSLGHGITQRVPIKKIAAGFGIATALAYMVISGMVIPAVRSTIMLALVFAAIIAGRQALTMRNVAIAALAIIVFEPTSVFRASFQLSFAAVIALIAAYELARRNRENRERPNRSRALALALDITTTSVIAGLATLVFTAYHFQQTAPFGVLGNLMVMPIVSFVMMPAALLGTLLLPLGLEAIPYAALGWSIEAMLWCAAFVRQLSGGFDPSPILSPLALIVALLALAWLAYFRTRIRVAGAILAVPLISAFCLEQPPDIFIADQSQAVAVRSGERVALIAGRNNTFATTIWSERYLTVIENAHPATGCDSLGCVLSTQDGYTIALVRSRDVFDEDCRIAEIVVTRLNAPPQCRKAATLVIDASDLARHGAHMINWNGPDLAPTIRTAIDGPDRPWRIQPQ
ncbi:competence protein ComEC [Pelagibacterium halotolerans]|uniref:DNA internalization-related competence protein ComEC/Rec2 n=2 Tax=Pelagibacterium TaxID=1082930 RepID=G4R8V6_PELHB|nr:DNA internalization-related competence protein ComEC/Rec2 [Pelagibacterium halotolerans B2]SEA92776.1 competence protein ComEC [Pelagibacterium halotolerans]